MKQIKRAKCPACKQRDLFYRNGLKVSKYCTPCRKEKDQEKKEKKKLAMPWLQSRGRPLTRKGLVGKADAAFSVFIRNRDKECVVCGKTEDLTCGHLFSRVAYSTRWDELNCHCQCVECNLSHEYDAQPFTSWFIRKFGIETYDDLHRQYWTKRRFSDGDIAEMWKRYSDRNKTNDIF